MSKQALKKAFMSRPLSSETVFVSADEEPTPGVMSDRVRTLASGLYEEMQRLIDSHGDSVVQPLMPHVISVLEGLDSTYCALNEVTVDFQLAQRDNAELLTQYEREKQRRKDVEQRLNETEDMNHQFKNDFDARLETFEHMRRQLELKNKNLTDHVSRLEDKDHDTRKELDDLRSRHNELMQNYLENLDKLKRQQSLIDYSQQKDLSRSISSNVFPFPNTEQNSVDYEVITSYKEQELIWSDSFETSKDSSRKSEAKYISSADIKRSNSQLKNTQDVVRSTSIKDVRDLYRITPSQPEEEPKSHRDSVNINYEEDDVEDTNMATTDVVKSLHTEINENDPAPVRTESSISVDEVPFSRTTRASSDASCEFTSERFRIDSVVAGDPKYQEGSLFQEMQLDQNSSVDIIASSNMAPSSLSVDYLGMSKEVENLIAENTQLQETKNALNVVKDDLIARVDELTNEQELMSSEVQQLRTSRKDLQTRVSELEEELKKLKISAESSNRVASPTPSDTGSTAEENTYGQRKKFSRVEMARVLMERNQYKEKLLELQEAVRWSEMLSKNTTAEREHPDLVEKRRPSSTWKLFSSLFGSSTQSNNTTAKTSPSSSIKYRQQPGTLTPSTKRSMTIDSNRALDFLDEDDTRQNNANTYKIVQKHVKQDDGRLHAYGWSLPSNLTTVSNDGVRGLVMAVPVPVYCRPLFENGKFKHSLLCAASVDLSGGRTKEGSNLIGGSVFYSTVEQPKDDIDRLSRQMELYQEQSKKRQLKQSSLVWVCIKSSSYTRVVIMDAENPSEKLSEFKVKDDSVLCVASVPGASEDDLCTGDEFDEKFEKSSPYNQENSSIVGVSVTKATPALLTTLHSQDRRASEMSNVSNYSDVIKSFESASKLASDNKSKDLLPAIEKELSICEEDGFVVASRAENDKSEESSPDSSQKSKDALFDHVVTSFQPTMWLGTQNGRIYVHSAVSRWKDILHTINVHAAVMSICHANGRVFACLANGSIIVFFRLPVTDSKDSKHFLGLVEGGTWDMDNFYLIQLGSNIHSSIRCCQIVYKRVWFGCRNKIYVLCPETLKIITCFDAHPRDDSQVRHMTTVGDGVWISIRLQSTIRLFHAHDYTHLQDLDVEPSINKILGVSNMRRSSFVRITTLHAAGLRLWIGTSNGVVVSIPLGEEREDSSSVLMSSTSSSAAPGGPVRIFSDSTSGHIRPSTFLPKCNSSQLQLSFHGHREDVRFFVSVLAAPSKSASATSQLMNTLVLSGGEGYIDFRKGDEDDGSIPVDFGQTLSEKTKKDKTHIIVWQMAAT